MGHIEAINPAEIQQRERASGKAMSTSKDFNAWLQAADAMSPMGATINEQYGSTAPTSQAVLASAFSGIQSSSQVTGGGGMAAPTFAGGSYGGARGGLYQTTGGVPGGSEPVIPGAEGFSTGDLINSMNQNNLHL